MSIYVKQSSGVSTIVDMSVLSPEFTLVGTYSGLEIRHCNIGSIHVMRIAGNLTSQIPGYGSLNITLPNTFNGGYYVSEYNQTGQCNYKVDKSSTSLTITNCNSSNIPTGTYIHKWLIYHQV